MKISAILVATGRVPQLLESLASFLSQKYEDRELIIVNVCPRQTLVGDFDRVRIYNFKQTGDGSVLPMRAKTWGINQAAGDVIIPWDEMSVYLPDFLTQIARSIEGKAWCWLDTEFVLEAQTALKKVQGSELSFAFTRRAFDECGGVYPPGIRGACDRNLIGNITQKHAGEKAVVHDSVNLIRLGSREEREAISPVINSGQIKLAPAWTRDYAMMAEIARTGKRESKLCFVELGRYGDIINLLPILKYVSEVYETPHLMTSAKFADLLDGVSYVKPVVTQLSNEKLGQALAVARQEYQIVINAQIWGEGWTQLKRTPCYNMESWSNCGMLHKFDDVSMRPVFDRRDLDREQLLLHGARGYDGRPMILVNVARAVSSPCPTCIALMTDIQNVWGTEYNIVDLSKITAHRLYDFLTLFENARCLICLDSAFLHLATATKLPVVALVNDKGEGWAATKVRCGNAVTHIPYSKINLDNRRHLHEGIAAALERDYGPANPVEIGERPKLGRIFHCVERHEMTPDERHLACWKSWDTLYERGEMIPSHFWNYPRTADKEIGDPRPLPYLKDLLQFTLNEMGDNDILLWTNADNILHAEVARYIRFHVSTYGPCTSFRSEFRGTVPPLELPPWQWDSTSAKHMGRDIFAATKKWIVEHWDEIGDWCLGASDFDLFLAAMVRNHYGIKTTNRNIAEQAFPAECVRGYVGHQYHQSYWSRPDNEKTAPSQLWNRRLFREWAAIHAPQLEFNAEGTLK